MSTLFYYRLQRRQLQLQWLTNTGEKLSLFILTTILTNMMTFISFSPHYPQAQPISCWPHWPSWRWFSSSRTTSWPPDDYTDPTETHTGLHRIIEDLSTKLIRSKWFKRIFYANSFWDQENFWNKFFCSIRCFGQHFTWRQNFISTSLFPTLNIK